MLVYEGRIAVEGINLVPLEYCADNGKVTDDNGESCLKRKSGYNDSRLGRSGPKSRIQGSLGHGTLTLHLYNAKSPS